MSTTAGPGEALQAGPALVPLIIACVTAAIVLALLVLLPPLSPILVSGFGLVWVLVLPMGAAYVISARLDARRKARSHGERRAPRDQSP